MHGPRRSYTPYASSLYVNSRYGNQWYMLLGATLCGIGASVLWCAEGLVVVGYPAVHQRGRMIGIWTAFRDFGPLIGGAISLSLNVKDANAGAVSYNTYLALIGLQCVGLPAALLLSSEAKVRRPDGSRPSFGRDASAGVKDELLRLAKAFKLRHILLLAPMYIVGLWGQTYQYNYLAAHFSVRSRALASLLSAVAALSADVTLAFVADLRLFGQTQRQRAITMWAGFSIALTALYVWQMVLEASFVGQEDVALDWADEPKARFNVNLAVYILWKFVFGAMYNFQFYIVGCYDYTPGDMPRVMGIIRGLEAVGSTFAYVVGATHWSNLNQGILSFALWVACIVPTSLALRLAPKRQGTDEYAAAQPTPVEEPVETSEQGSLSKKDDLTNLTKRIENAIRGSWDLVQH